MTKENEGNKIIGGFKPYRYLTISALFIILVGTIVYHFAEGWRWLDSIYYSVITLTTVGYGDFSPKTDFGKIFTIFYVLTGIGIIFGYINTIYTQRSERLRKIQAGRSKSRSK